MLDIFYKIINFIIFFLFFSLLISCSKDETSPITPGVRNFVMAGEYAGIYWPTNGWRVCKPEAVGMNSEKLNKVYDYAANTKIKTDAVIIIKDGYIIAESYFNTYKSGIKHPCYSIAKSVTSAIVGIASDQGLITDLNYEIYNYFPEWQILGTDEKKKKITIRHILTMTSGLEWIENQTDNPLVSDDNTSMYNSYDFLKYVLKKPVIKEPGAYWFYSNGASLLPSGIIEKIGGPSVLEFGRSNLFLPIGIIDLYWESDPAGHTLTGWGFSIMLRDLAKFGYLFLKEGEWSGRQIISKNWIKESTKAFSSDINFYGYFWWLPTAFSNYQNYNIPEKTFFALGARQQLLAIIPEKNLLAIRLGDDIVDTGGEWETLKFIRLILDSIN